MLLSLLLFSTCSNETAKPAKGEVSFTFNGGTSTSGRVMTSDTPAFVKYVIENASGESLTNTVAVHAFGSSYVSTHQSFSTGNYKLKEYYVLNSDNAVVFAAVVSGSSLANLVNVVLPLSFSVVAGETTLVAPDVLPVTDEMEPEDFGYVKWSFNVVATLVKFKLPIQEDIIENFSSATLKITQGSYTHTEKLHGMPGAGLYANMLVKKSTPIEVSLTVDTYNVLTGSYHVTMDGDILNKSSISKFELTQTLQPISSGEFVFAEFRHKVGKGWNFRYAEITTNGKNGSWIKVKYHGDQLCGGPLTVTTNASSFSYQYPDWMDTDKYLWSDTDFDVTESVLGVTKARFGQPVCENGICTLSADLDYNANDPYDSSNPYSEYANIYSKYGSACAANEWVLMDSWTTMTTIHNGQKNSLNAYFIIYRDMDGASSAGRIKAGELVKNADPKVTAR